MYLQPTRDAKRVSQSLARQMVVENLCFHTGISKTRKTLTSSVIIWELYWSQDRENERERKR